VQIWTVVAPLLAANCYVLADDDGRCVVIDPGAGVLAGVADVVDAHGLRPVGVLATHGHVDHTWDAAGLCDTYGVALHLHDADVYRTTDPFGSLGPLGPQLAAMAASAGMVHRLPARVVGFAAPAREHAEITVGAEADAGPLVLRVLHSPGHTQGSTVYLADIDGAETALTGDVLFAGSIGRTDLPGGDDAAMALTLRRLRSLPGSTRLRPGHGPASLMSTELLRNPFLR
jgi:glyoxylase-like metal-dependent hydrolase (beta-lactamase superfamily II)